ncbi:MAG TPA: hypothetical protein VMU15_03360 [Anaeromyxobacter sp.]|nr:hypothetical protein [Anaeromyxobacter sp.]
MSRRRGSGPEGPGIPGVYEGPEVLSALLAKAGAPITAEEVAERFRKAQAAGEPRSGVIPGLFPDEPRFASPDEARRLYGNLFGLWGRLAAGLGAHDDAPDVWEPEEPLPLPERGSQAGDVLSADLVERVWTSLADSPPREVQRKRDRFQNSQPDLWAWLESLALPQPAAVAVQDLAFEAWAMFDQAFGERLGTVAYRDLRELEKEPPPLDQVQPALAAYAAEQLELAGDEEPALDPAARAQAERALAALGVALTDAVVLPS